MAERQDERDEDEDEIDEAEDSSDVEPEPQGGKDSLERIAVDLLCNHTLPFGTVSDVSGCQDAADMLPNGVADAIANAMFSAAMYLKRKFDNS